VLAVGNAEHGWVQRVEGSPDDELERPVPHPPARRQGRGVDAGGEDTDRRRPARAADHASQQRPPVDRLRLASAGGHHEPTGDWSRPTPRRDTEDATL
jgi:hypothetical protein